MKAGTVQEKACPHRFGMMRNGENDDNCIGGRCVMYMAWSDDSADCAIRKTAEVAMDISCEMPGEWK